MRRELELSFIRSVSAIDIYLKVDNEIERARFHKCPDKKEYELCVLSKKIFILSQMNSKGLGLMLL